MRDRLVFFGEGEGDAVALPLLGKKVFKEMPGAFEGLQLDENPFRVGGFSKVLKKEVKDPLQRTNLHRLLEAALKRRGTKAVLLVLDGDHKADFCPGKDAEVLLQEARKAGAGVKFFFAVCFAVKEYESWFIAAASKMTILPSGWKKPGCFPADTESAPRDAKGWIAENLLPGYDPVGGQGSVTQAISLGDLRKGGTKSFKHFEKALRYLVDAVKNGESTGCAASA